MPISKHYLLVTVSNMLKVFKSRSKITVKVTPSKYQKKGLHLSEETQTSNLNAPSLTVEKLWAIKVFKKLVKGHFKTTGSKFMTSSERSCHKELTCPI